MDVCEGMHCTYSVVRGGALAGGPVRWARPATLATDGAGASAGEAAGASEGAAGASVAGAGASAGVIAWASAGAATGASIGEGAGAASAGARSGAATGAAAGASSARAEPRRAARIRQRMTIREGDWLAILGDPANHNPLTSRCITRVSFIIDRTSPEEGNKNNPALLELVSGARSKTRRTAS